jgi:probable rRNA maturation factor
MAFPMQEGSFREITPDLLGDVVISTETALRHAQEAGLSLSAVIDRLLVHGVLHLLGYDHEGSDAEARRMAAKEEDIVRALNRGGNPIRVRKH